MADRPNGGSKYPKLLQLPLRPRKRQNTPRPEIQKHYRISPILQHQRLETNTYPNCLLCCPSGLHRPRVPTLLVATHQNLARICQGNQNINQPQKSAPARKGWGLLLTRLARPFLLLLSRLWHRIGCNQKRVAAVPVANASQRLDSCSSLDFATLAQAIATSKRQRHAEPAPAQNPSDFPRDPTQKAAGLRPRLIYVQQGQW